MAPQVSVFAQSAQNERNFTHMLYEDQTEQGNLSYADFMFHLHNQVLLTRAM